MRTMARALTVFVLVGAVAGSVSFPTRPVYTVREDRGIHSNKEPMYWVYASSWPFGLGYQLEAGFESRERALEYVQRARERDIAERSGDYGDEIIR